MFEKDTSSMNGVSVEQRKLQERQREEQRRVGFKRSRDPALNDPRLTDRPKPQLVKDDKKQE